MSKAISIADVREQARRYARVSSSSASNEQVNFLIGQAMDEFALAVGGLPFEENIAIAAKFTTETNMAINITTSGGASPIAGTDVLITSTARENATGTQVASDFQTTLQAAGTGSETVTWSNFNFVIDLDDATSVTFAAPTTKTYTDARDLLGIPASPTLSSNAFTGNFPQDCTKEQTLPTDVISMDYVEWDKNELYPLSPEYFVSPETSGTPLFYSFRDRYIRLYPPPTRDDFLHVEYRGLPEELNEVFQGYQECGLSSLTPASATGLSASTTYYYKITIDGGTQTEYSITTGTVLSYSAMIALMNVQNIGAKFAIVDGDLRCTSNSMSPGSTIALAAGTSGTDLFATLTSFSAFETAVSYSNNLPGSIVPPYHQAVIWLTAAKLKEETGEFKEAQPLKGEYLKLVFRYKVFHHSQDTEVRVGRYPRRLPGVTMPT